MTTPPLYFNAFRLIPLDGGSFEQNAALLRAEVRMRWLMEFHLPPPPDPRAFVILSSVG
jgi:hypothetical protein